MRHHMKQQSIHLARFVGWACLLSCALVAASAAASGRHVSNGTTCATGITPCSSDVDCNATAGCHRCSQVSFTCVAHSKCLSSCGDDGDCAGAGNCTICAEVAPFQGGCVLGAYCGMQCITSVDCSARGGNTCIECNPTTRQCERSKGKCHSPCATSADCLTDCSSCAYGACINPSVPGQCGSTCTHQANCTGECNACVGGTCALPWSGDKSALSKSFP